MQAVRRHCWVRIDPIAAADVVASCRVEDQRAFVARWLQRGQPLVARARQSDDDPSRQALGLCLPPSLGKLRIALSVAPEAMLSIEEAPALDAVASVLSPFARVVALTLADQARALGFTARVFGSAAWQFKTGETYLTESSDLDLLATPPDAEALAQWLGFLGALEGRAPMRLDGEIEDASGDAVNWRELASGAPQVLIKSQAGAQLVSADTVRAAFQ